MTTRKIVGLLLLLVAYGLLYPGLTQPLLTLTGTVAKTDLVSVGRDIIVDSPQTNTLVSTMVDAVLSQIDVTGDVEAYNKTRSILGTIRDLYQDGFALVAFLVALFSIGVPLIKGLMLLFANLPLPAHLRQTLDTASNLISKWSMADVFVVGVFVAFLAANAIKREGGLLSFSAELGSGFYFFLGYCLVSILATQVLVVKGAGDRGQIF